MPPASKKPPSRARKPSTKAKAAKNSDEDLPAPTKKKVAKSKATQKKKVLELSDGDEGPAARGENDDDDVGDADEKVE
jgi:hypothetical protein